MDRTEAAVQKTLAAVDAPLYDLGILSDRGMFPRMDALTAAQCMARVRYLKHRNAHEAHIYFRPSGERRFTLLDDLSRTLLADLSAHGFEPCAVIETSPENFQVWLRHSRVLSKELGTVAAQLLARRFGADPSAADWRRFGRLPGFTNRKPQHRQNAGLFPFVRLHGHTGQQFTAAELFELEAQRLYHAKIVERQRQRESFRPWFGKAPLLDLSRFRTSARYEGRPAAADMAFSVAAIANGWSMSQVADALASNYLSRNPSQSRRAAYVRRTIDKAKLWVRA